MILSLSVIRGRTWRLPLAVQDPLTCPLVVSATGGIVIAPHSSRSHFAFIAYVLAGTKEAGEPSVSSSTQNVRGFG